MQREGQYHRLHPGLTTALCSLQSNLPLLCKVRYSRVCAMNLSKKSTQSHLILPRNTEILLESSVFSLLGRFLGYEATRKSARQSDYWNISTAEHVI
jgi:hypothetical protein